MNTRYTQLFIYLSRISRHSNKGFMLVLAGAIGVVMAVTATAMLLNSSSKSQQVMAQQATSQGKSMSEVAVARIQFLLNKYEFLAEHDISDWDTVEVQDKLAEAMASSCETQDATATEQKAIKDEIKAFAARQWRPIDPNNPAQGEYKVVGYQAPSSLPGLAKIKVQGRTNAANKLQESPTQLYVEAPINPTTVDDENVPGLWIKEGDTEKSGGNKNLFAGNIWLSDCDLGGKTDDQVKTALADIAANVVAGTADAASKGEIPSGTTFKAPKLAAYDFPDLPSVPTYLPPSQKGLTISSKKASTPPVSSSPVSGCGINSGTGNVFPRAGDTPKIKTINDESICIYEYEVTSIDGSATVNTVSDDGKRQKVIFHLLGDMNKGSDIDWSCGSYSGNADLCKPTDFQLFGHAASGKICLNGNNKFHGFLFAPGYDAGVNGSGGGKGGINGAAWVKTWNKTSQCSSNSQSGAMIVQTGTWAELGVGSPKGMPPVTVGQPTKVQTEEYDPNM